MTGIPASIARRDARQNARREVTRAEGFDDNSIDRGIGAGVDQKRRHAEISLNELHIAVKTTDIVGFLSREAVVENDFSIDHRSHRPALGGKKGVHMIGVTLDNAAGGKNILIEKNHYPPLPGAGIGGDPDGAEKVADVIDIFFARTLHCAGKNDRLWAGKNQGGEIRHLLNRICPMRDDRAGDVLAFERLPNFLGKAQPIAGSMCGLGLLQKSYASISILLSNADRALSR